MTPKPGSNSWFPSRYELEQVVLRGSYPNTKVEILFRDPQRPQCLYGYDWGSVWRHVGFDTPETLVGMIIANLMETIDVDGLPECDPNGVTWIARFD